jgi:hypothetical protein
MKIKKEQIELLKNEDFYLQLTANKKNIGETI